MVTRGKGCGEEELDEGIEKVQMSSYNGIPVKPCQILKDDAVKVLH